MGKNKYRTYTVLRMTCSYVYFLKV